MLWQLCLAQGVCALATGNIPAIRTPDAVRSVSTTMTVQPQRPASATSVSTPAWASAARTRSAGSSTTTPSAHVSRTISVTPSLDAIRVSTNFQRFVRPSVLPFSAHFLANLKLNYSLCFTRAYIAHQYHNYLVMQYFICLDCLERSKKKYL